MSVARDRMRGVAPVPMSAPDISELEVSCVSEVLRSGCLSIGPRLEEFERRFASYLGRRHAIGVSSGTAGLHLAVLAAGVSAGDLVVTTPFSFIASSNCVLYEHAIPVFVDVDPVTGNIDPSLVCEAVRDLCGGGEAARRWLPRSHAHGRIGTLKAILPVHAFGQPAEMQCLAGVAMAQGLALIEDACEAIGAERHRQRAGTFGDAGVFAFYPNKQMTTGEGGMIVTDRDDWCDAFRALRNQGRDQMAPWLEHRQLGYNYRLDELSAALGLAQFSRLDDLLDHRARVARWYDERLTDLPGVTLPTVVAATTRMSWFVYVIRLDATIDRQMVMADLAAQAIPSRAYFAPIHLQPFYAASFGYRRGDFPIAERLGDTSLALPFSGTMTADDVDRVCDALVRAVAHHVAGA
jgi:perosamine synthetase